MEYNNRIAVNFTDKEGKRRKDVYGIKSQACAYARLLSELGYNINDVRDEYTDKPIDWRNSRKTS